MLLPGFQNFPAKCPKSKIFLRNPATQRQEKKNYTRPGVSEPLARTYQGFTTLTLDGADYPASLTAGASYM